MSRYKPPELDGHKVAFKGRRFWVIEVEEGRDFEHVSKDYADLAIYDAAEQMVIGWALREEGGGFRCGTSAGQVEIRYHVEKLEDLGRVTDAESWQLCRACS
jgi:hypothetical protein